MNPNLLVLGLPGQSTLMNDLARRLGAQASELAVRQFPDGETLVRIETEVQDRIVVIACSLDHPDAKTLPLIFAADAARELGALRVGLAAPYLSYMRQDHRFHPGEAVTSRSFARMLSASLDFLVTVDPHLHRWHSLDQIYTLRSQVVPSAPRIAQWLRANVENPLVVGPDSESEQWVAEVARLAQAPSMVLAKTRRGDRDVSVVLDRGQARAGCTPVLVDDIASTGRTLVAAAQALREAGLPVRHCVAVHALFEPQALGVLREAGLTEVATCDTIAHPTNAIAMGEDLAQAVRSLATA